jgi:hypothetical protein
VGKEGRPGERVVVEEIVRRHDGPGMLHQIVARDMPQAEVESAVYQRLHRMQTQLATLERANRNLLAKLHASKPMSVTFQTHVPPSAPAAGPQRPSTSAGEQGARADGDDVVITRVTRVDDPVASIDLRDEDSEDVEAEDSSGSSRSAGSAGGSGG